MNRERFFQEVKGGGEEEINSISHGMKVAAGHELFNDV